MTESIDRYDAPDEIDRLRAQVVTLRGAMVKVTTDFVVLQYDASEICKEADARIAEIEAQVETLREALARYADDLSWEFEEWSDTERDYLWRNSDSPIAIAKAALAATEAK